MADVTKHAILMVHLYHTVRVTSAILRLDRIVLQLIIVWPVMADAIKIAFTMVLDFLTVLATQDIT